MACNSYIYGLQSDLTVLSPAIVTEYGTSVRDIAICSARLVPWSKSWTSVVTFGGTIPLSLCSPILSQNEWMIALSTSSKVFRLWLFIISLTECNTDTTQKLPFGVHTTIELKNIRTTLDSTVIHLSQDISRQTPFLSDVDVIFSRSTLVLTTNGQLLEYANIAFSELWDSDF